MAGSLVLRDADYPGSVEAWADDGDAVTVYDAIRGRRDEERFAVRSPCRVVHSRSIHRDPYLDGGPGEEIVTTDTFVFASDGLHVAMAPAASGFRRGALVSACVGNRVYTFNAQDGRCQSWAEAIRRPRARPPGGSAGSRRVP